MFEKRGEDLEAQRRPAEPREHVEPVKRISDMEMFKLPGASYRVVTVPKDQAN